LGLRVLYINRPNIYGLFEGFQESFVFGRKQISFKSVIFQNSKEIDLFKDNIQSFFDKLAQKDLNKFVQNS